MKTSKRMIFILLIIILYSCSNSTFIEPKITFTNKNILIENNSNFDYFNIEILFANKYKLAYLNQAKSSRLKFKYSSVTPNSSFRELNKNNYSINFQDSIGNNYQVIRNKIIITNNVSTNFITTLKEVLSSSTGLTIIMGLVAAFVALHQVKSNVISSSRIKWIEEFKKNISEHDNAVCQMIYNYGMHIKYYKNKTIPNKKNAKYYDEYVKFHYQVNLYRSNLLINLNLDEKIYKNIKVILNQIQIKLDETPDTKDENDELYRNVTSLLYNLRVESQKALKFEWKKSKRMFYINWKKKFIQD